MYDSYQKTELNQHFLIGCCHCIPLKWWQMRNDLICTVLLFYCLIYTAYSLLWCRIARHGTWWAFGFVAWSLICRHSNLIHWHSLSSSAYVRQAFIGSRSGWGVIDDVLLAPWGWPCVHHLCWHTWSLLTLRAQCRWIDRMDHQASYLFDSKVCVVSFPFANHLKMMQARGPCWLVVGIVFVRGESEERNDNQDDATNHE